MADIVQDVIVLGASAGGVQAVRMVLAGLPSTLGAAVLVVIHRSRESPSLLSQVLYRATGLPVDEVNSRVRLERGKVYVAAADRHLTISRDLVTAAEKPRDARHRPSIDVLFRSAAEAYGRRVIGVVLTGLGSDGSAGLVEIKRAGGLAVVEDPATAAHDSMPLHAMRAVNVDHCVPLAGIAPLLVSLTS